MGTLVAPDRASHAVGVQIRCALVRVTYGMELLQSGASSYAHALPTVTLAVLPAANEAVVARP
ncbi:MAG: hypothetical protein DLM56_13005 [Pseudonocardiales bacterium]|nr:MAG: hypothetical protein DLM56_13005 [Pseudonocardiales bacterium]